MYFYLFFTHFHFDEFILCNILHIAPLEWRLESALELWQCCPLLHKQSDTSDIVMISKYSSEPLVLHHIWLVQILPHEFVPSLQCEFMFTVNKDEKSKAQFEVVFRHPWLWGQCFWTNTTPHLYSVFSYKDFFRFIYLSFHFLRAVDWFRVTQSKMSM